MLDFLFKPLNGLIGEVVDRVLPNKQEAAKLKAELELQLLQADFSRYEKEVEDRASARALAQADVSRGNAYTNVLAALHRPVWSFVILGLFSFSIIGPALGLPEIPISELQADVMKTVIIFYFGGRSVEKVFNMKKS